MAFPNSLVLLLFGLCGFHVSMALKIRRGASIVIFGDSLSDNGNYFADPLLGNKTRPVVSAIINGVKRKAYYNGRFTNYPGVWNDHLRAMMVSASIANYAYAGGAMCSGYTKRPILHVPEQVDKYIKAKSKATLHNRTIPVIWAGGNDVQYVIGFNPGQLGGLPARIVECMVNATKRLLNSGEDVVVLATLPPMDKAPFTIRLKLDKLIAPFVTGINTGIKQAAAELATAYKAQNKSVVVWDIYTEISTTFTNYRKLGFKYGPDVDCLNATSTFSSLLDVPKYVCPKPEEYSFFDDVHPSSKAHRTVATSFINLLYPLKWITNNELKKPRKVL